MLSITAVPFRLRRFCHIAMADPQHQSYVRFLERLCLLTVVLLLLLLFGGRGMLWVCLILLPFLYLIDLHPPYQQLNTKRAINAVVDSIPPRSSEAANWFSQLLSLIWPHLFPQARVDFFKEKLQSVIDAYPMPNISSIQLNSLEIGDNAPQIMEVSFPDQGMAAENSLLFEAKAVYCPTSFSLNALISLKSVPAFKITFTDLTLMLDLYVQLEFKPDPYLPNIPFWTGMDMSLATKPELPGFNVTLFSNSNLINKDSIKSNMSTMFSNLLWQYYGMPKGFVWERTTGVWRNAMVRNSTRLSRCSVSDSELIRYSRIKTQASELCQRLRIADPLTLRIIAHQDKSVSTRHFELLFDFMHNVTLDKIAEISEVFNTDPPSPDELTLFVEGSYNMFLQWFNKYSSKSLKKGMTKGIEEIIQYAYIYMNFLSLQKKVNSKTAEKLELEKKVKTLEQVIFKFHNKICKK